MNLYRFFVDCGRSGYLEGLFVAQPEELNEAYGTTLYFGEVLGKHSEVTVKFDPEDITLISEDKEFVKKLVEIVGVNVSGFNPLSYYNEQMAEED